MFVFFCRPADALLSSEPGGGQGNLATHTVAQGCMFCRLFFVTHVILFSLCYAFSARHFSPLAGLWVVPPFHFVLVFAFCLPPPRHCGSLREGFDHVFSCLRACVLLQFAFLRLVPPRHADDTREGFDGGWSCHSAFFVSPPRHTGGTWQVLTGGLPSYSVCVSFNYFLRVFLAS